MAAAPVASGVGMILAGGFLPRPVVPQNVVRVGRQAFAVLQGTDFDLNRFVSPRPLNERVLAKSQTIAGMKACIWEEFRKLTAPGSPSPLEEGAAAPDAEEEDAAELLGLAPTPTKRGRRNSSKSMGARLAALPATMRVTMPCGWSFLALTPQRGDQPPSMEFTPENWRIVSPSARRKSRRSIRGATRAGHPRFDHGKPRRSAGRTSTS